MSNEMSVAGLQWVEIALSRLLSTLVPTKCMIDVGAHHGTSLEPFLRAGWNVHAFEPIEANRRVLAASFAGADKLVIRSEAASNETGTRAFHLALNLDGSLHEYHHSLEQINEDPWHKKGPTVSVPTVRLDDLAANGDIPCQIGFLKIDTEGHDLAVLHGASQLACEVISVEFWGDAHALGKSPSPASAMVELLRCRGYDSFVVLSHDGDATAALYSSMHGVRADSWGNLFFFRNADLYRRLIEHRDWLFVIEMSGECDQLRFQLRRKQQVIQELGSAAAERLQIIEQLQATAAERLQLIERMARELARSPLKRILKSIALYLPGFTHVGRKSDAA
jgi:FkbM family methyltransferase